MRKLLLVLMLSMMMVTGLAGCGGQPAEQPPAGESAAGEGTEAEEDGEEDTKGTPGRWEVDPGAKEAQLPEEVRAAFLEATEFLTGTEFTPLAYFGRQEGNGTDYQILCRSTLTSGDPQQELQVVVVHTDPQEGAEMENIANFDLSRYDDDEGAPTDKAGASGGWQIPEDHTTVNLVEDLQTALDEGDTGIGGCVLTPIALLGSRTGRGSDLAVLVKSDPLPGGKLPGARVAVIHKDPDGGTQLENLCTLDPADFDPKEDGADEQ